MLLDLTELSSYLPLVPCFEFGNASGTLFPCTEGRVRTIMTSAGTPRAGAFGQQTTEGTEKEKKRKKTDNPREGWEDGTPPPHRDFKERSVMR